MRTADATLVREREDPLGPRVERLVNGMAEAGHLAAIRADSAGDVTGDVLGRAPAGHLLLGVLEQPCARFRGAEHDRPASEDPGRDGTLQRVGVGGKGHPSRDVRRHHPVLGDRDQQDVEEEALVVRRLAAGEEQVEVLGQAEPPHQVARQVATANLHPVGVGLGDSADGRSGGPDLHAPILAFLLAERLARSLAQDPRRPRADRSGTALGGAYTASASPARTTRRMAASIVGPLEASDPVTLSR